MRIPIDLVEKPEVYWYKEHERLPYRDKRFPPTPTEDRLILDMLKRSTPEFLDALERKKVEVFVNKMNAMSLMFRDAEFMRPRATVFDSAGNFARTRVDEQSIL